VISPLLANVYLHVLDRIWKEQKVQERYGARLIRYADDCAPRRCGKEAEMVT
jgi:RNA-directed DNA polymerase